MSIVHSVFFISVSFLTHLRLIHASEEGFQIPCGLQGCQRTFNNFYTYRNHVYSMHDLSGLDTTTSRSTDIEASINNESTENDNTIPDIETLHDVEENYESSEVVSLTEGRCLI